MAITGCRARGLKRRMSVLCGLRATGDLGEDFIASTTGSGGCTSGSTAEWIMGVDMLAMGTMAATGIMDTSITTGR